MSRPKVVVPRSSERHRQPLRGELIADGREVRGVDAPATALGDTICIGRFGKRGQGSGLSSFDAVVGGWPATMAM